MSTIRLEGKATIHRAGEIHQACKDALAEAQAANADSIDVDWAGSLGLDSSVLQLLLAVSREKQLCGHGDPSESVRDTLTLAGLDLSVRPISNPE